MEYKSNVSPLLLGSTANLKAFDDVREICSFLTSKLFQFLASYFMKDPLQPVLMSY